jgi:sulfur carrier protein ThiS adenylyltransferase
MLHRVRHADLINEKCYDIKIDIIGVGAIGSFAALQLVKMGFENITVWDHDTVSTENMSCQFFRFKDIGKPKVLALQEIIEDFTGVKIAVHNRKWDSLDAHLASGIVIPSVDSMDVRKDILKDMQDAGVDCKWIIDPRMAAESMTLLVVKPSVDLEYYTKFLFDDSDAVQERCTAKSTIYTVNLAAGMIAKAVKNVVMGENYTRRVAWNIKTSNQNSMMTFEGSH